MIKFLQLLHVSNIRSVFDHLLSTIITTGQIKKNGDINIELSIIR